MGIIEFLFGVLCGWLFRSWSYRDRNVYSVPTASIFPSGYRASQSDIRRRAELAKPVKKTKKRK